MAPLYVKRIAAVAARSYYLLGDNRRTSCDSRQFGPVSRAEIVGRAVAVVWPLGRLRIL